MPILQSAERITRVLFLDSQGVKTWRVRVRVDAISALSLANHQEYAVFGVRNTRGTLLGIIAVQETEENVYIKHMATRDTARELSAALISAVQDLAGKRRIVSRYPVPNWRKVGKEYWSS